MAMPPDCPHDPHRRQTSREGFDEAARLAALRACESIEAALHEREERLDAYVSAFPDIMFVLDEDGRYIEARGSDESLLYANAKALLGRTMHEVLPKETADLYLGTVHETLRTGKSRILEYELRGPAGLRHFEARTAPLGGLVGGRKAVVWVSRDITDRKAAEHALSESEQHYRRLIELTPSGVFVQEEGKVAYANPACVQIFRAESPEDLIGRSVSDLVHPEHRALMAERTAQLFAGNRPLPALEQRLLRLDGGPIEAEITMIPFPLHGRPAAEVLVRDITERKRLERRLAAEHTATRILSESETLREAAPALLRSICECLGWQIGVIWSIDSKASVLRCVEAWCDPSTPGDRFVELTRSFALEAGVGLPGMAWSGKEPIWIPDLTCITASPRAPIAKEIDIHGAFAVPLRIGDQVLGVMEFFSRSIEKPDEELLRMMASVGGKIGLFIQRRQADKDLKRYASELEAIRKRLELQADELTAARDEALDAAALRGQFLATVSHEIRTPMNGIIGMTELLLDTRLDADQRDYAETVRTSADALLSIINDILDFSKMDAGRMKIDSIDFDLRTAVEHVVGLFREKVASKGVELSCLIQPDVPETACGDPGRLRQVLVNLIGNAVKFTDSGEVVVRVGLAAQSKDRSLVQFSVADTGIGISPQAQRKIFLPFTQADGSLTRRFGGTGLGLAISRELISLMGGSIELESEIGKGSTFTALIPLRKRPIRQEAPKRRHGLRGTSALVLSEFESGRCPIADDLRGWGVVVTTVPTPVAALSELRAASDRGTPFDVALVDLTNALEDALAFARVVKSDSIGEGLSLVLLTVAGQPGEGASASSAGFAAFLTKPLSSADLREALVALLAQRGRGAKGTAPLVTRHSLAEDRARDRSRILVVEDNVVNQKVAVRVLEKLGYRADVVGDGVEAVAAVQRVLYDAVLMDCHMPNMDGYDATRAIRALGEAHGILPIIAMTADAMKGTEDRCIDAGMNACLTKPVRSEDLAMMLEKWIFPAEPGEPEAPEPPRPIAAAPHKS